MDDFVIIRAQALPPVFRRQGERVFPRNQGFSLLELAIALFILSLLLGGLIMPLAAQQQARQWRAAEHGLADIHAALLGYAVLHGHLPCPDWETGEHLPGYGVAIDHCVTPPAGEGFLPFKSLGLENGRDPWGNRWRYRVDRKFASAAAPIALDTDFSGEDRLKIVNLQNTALTTDSERPVALIYSTGPNGRPDGENASFEAMNGRYQSGPPTPEFDDQMSWLARPALMSRLVAAGRVR
ncbi:MAG: prepilin-type N-terminal cleavage/methylation domain-containing protein [Zoogloeaceae bacterium]|jgi:prepilin-type N-terminal cleavage/methylation domain-containing protein|nr:prepilin-type N-terminal cleavage/methylation domain-containing protein [Zoogloeaceae bacterium]